MMKSNKLNKPLILLLITLVLASCGGGSDDTSPKDNSNESNLEFVAKAQAISFNSVELYEGYVSLDDVNRAGLNVQNLESGQLISIEIGFELLGDLDDYSLTVQLVPENILNNLGQGDTLGELTDGKATTLKLDGVETLGSVYIDKIQSGQMNAIVQAKLPVLEEGQEYKIVVTPSLYYLSSGKYFSEADANIVPLYIDDRMVVINKLDKVKVEIVNLPELEEDNEFTRLEQGGKFDTEGYAIDPVFQTSIKLDVTTFNKSEEVSLLLTWAHPVSGLSLPVGLLSSDANGNPVISDNARFTIRPGDATFVTLPVVAYAPVKTQVELLKQAINIKDIADQNAVNGEFSLEVFYDDAGTDVSAGRAYSLTLPLVSQNNRVIANDVNEVIGFSALRAGESSTACLFAPVDIDSGQFNVNSTPEILASNCTVTPDDNSLWRYDVASKHYINKATDFEGNNYCITAFGLGILPDSYHLEICRFDDQSNTAIVAQRFILEEEKIRLQQFPAYLDVVFSAALNKAVQLEYDVAFADNFSTFSINSDGRIFYAANFVDRIWGDKDSAAVTLSYGGESFADYLPVIGTTTQGHATFTASLLGKSADIFDARFAIKKHLPKKISITGNNSPDVEVENGAKLDIDVIGGFSAVHLGGLTKSTITETYSSSDVTSVIFANVPDIATINKKIPVTTMDIGFLDIRFTVIVVPIQIKGGIKGDVGFDVKLSTPGLGLDVAVIDTFKLSGYLKATADLLLASATLDATIDVLDQNITFITKGGFVPEVLPATNILFNFDSSMTMSLKLLKGTVTAEYEYDYWLDSGEGEYVIYESDYLFNDSWVIYDESVSAAGVTY